MLALGSRESAKSDVCTGIKVAAPGAIAAAAAADPEARDLPAGGIMHKLSEAGLTC